MVRRRGLTTMGCGPPSQSSTAPLLSCELRIANRIWEIERVATLVASFGARHNLPENVIFALGVSLDEVLNNVISYGYDDALEHEILVRLTLQGEEVEVIVEDHGKPFNPLSLPAPNLEAKDRIGGVGIQFVRRLTDEIQYARRDGVNQLRLIKKI